jgi:hypothetical protein
MAALHKVTYRPIEAAIRWSGLTRHESQILAALNHRVTLQESDFPQWPTLRLNSERIHDAIINCELPFAINGITAKEKPHLDDPNLTVRHVELKAWMEHYYPTEKPQFLFTSLERAAHPVITIESVHVLMFERDTLKSQLAQKESELRALRSKYGIRLEAPGNAPIHGSGGTCELSPRREATYLHIVGALLHLLLGRSPAGQPYSSFINQEAVISAMIAHHGERLGITERTLRAKFAEAKRRLASMA